MTPTVTSRINYSVPMERRPFIVNGDFSQNDVALSPVEMLLRNGAQAAVPARLDVEGFACVKHAVDTTDLADSKDAAAMYRATLVPLMLELTGADEIIMLAHDAIRRQERATAENTSSPTAEFAHSDYSGTGWEQAVAMFDPPSRPGVKRTAMYNMWRLLSQGPTNCPLAICDSSSVVAEDIILGDSRFPALDAVFEMAFLRHNPAHRWTYYPDLTSDELLVFKQADSAPGHPQLTPHTAFTDESCGAHVAPRVSIESRCVAVWYS